MPKKQNSTRKQFRGMKMVIGRKSKKNNIKPKQYKKSKRYGKSKRYNKTQRGGGWGNIKNNLNLIKEIKEKAHSALNDKKNEMQGFITNNKGKINVKETKIKFLEKLNAAKNKIESLILKLNNDNVNIDDRVVNEGAEFFDTEDIELNEELNDEGLNDEDN